MDVSINIPEGNYEPDKEKSRLRIHHLDCFTTFLFPLLALGIVILLSSGIYLATKTQSQETSSWWSVLNFVVLFLNIVTVSFLCLQFRRRRNESQRLRVAFYTIESLTTKNLDHPTEFTEFSRRKEYWRKGEFKDLTLAYFSARELWRDVKLGTAKMSSSTNTYLEAELSLKDLETVQNQISRQLSSLFHGNNISLAAGEKMKQEYFIWYLSRDIDGKMFIVVMKEKLILKLWHYSMAWEDFTNDRGDYAGCKALIRRGDGEYVGPCGGHECKEPRHCHARNIFSGFLSIKDISLVSGCSTAEEIQDFRGVKKRFLVGKLETYSRVLSKKQMGQPVWVKHKWKGK
mmetsp:Transcript_16322/g.18484  ORF Transcript_16322/g.18484 Transcript_16322/m.18484 type:complete len:345 (+) Transcript_16322:107-1141(+)